MPIYVPGKRDKHNRPASRSKRTLVAALSLTAMVDMFTVLVVFLLQNYKTTGEIIILNKDIELPKASETKELKPSNIVLISNKAILIDKLVVADFTEVKEQKSWMINNLYTTMQALFQERERSAKANLQNTVNQVVSNIRNNPNYEPEDVRKITLQADKNIDFLTIKKVMYTLTEAGASEINFAVIQNEEKIEGAETLTN
ncbi:MAG: biopolymer transporter ExbD [Bdellovibrionales bacterium]|nr:biopolymer transporter ExbD [Bdellovibrionales bacterium]